MPDDALVGVRIEGSVTFLTADAGQCWTVRYDAGDGDVESPVVIPDGYTTAEIVMADPMHPGQDYPNPALMDPDGQPVAFPETRAILAAEYMAIDDPAVAADAERCGWTSPALVPDDPFGVTLDPDGLDTVVRTCSSADGAQPTPGEVWDECVDEPYPTPAVTAVNPTS